MFNSLKKKKNTSRNLLCCICVLRKALPSLVGQKPPWQSHLLPMLGALFMNFTGFVWHALSRANLNSPLDPNGALSPDSFMRDWPFSSVWWPLCTCFSSIDSAVAVSDCVLKSLISFIYFLVCFLKAWFFFLNQNHVLWQHLTEQFHFKGVLASFFPWRFTSLAIS